MQVAATIAYALATLGLMLSASANSWSIFATIVLYFLAITAILAALNLAPGKQFQPFGSRPILGKAFPWLIALVAIAHCNLFILRGIGQLLQEHYGLGSLLFLFGALPLLSFLLPRARTFWGTIGLFVWLSVSTVFATQPSAVPCSHLQQASSALLGGTNPYDEIYVTEAKDPNKTRIDLDPLRQLPAVLGAVLPSYYVTGDVRWTMLFALVASTFLLRSIMDAALQPTSRNSLLSWLPLAVLYHPYTRTVLREGHPAPLILLAITVTLWSSRANSIPGKIVGLAGLISTSIVGVVCVPVFALLGRFRARTLLAGIALATLPVIPFLVWNHSAMLTMIDIRPRFLVAFFAALALGLLLSVFHRNRDNAEVQPVSAIALIVAAALICFQLCFGSPDRSAGWVACVSLLVAMRTTNSPDAQQAASIVLSNQLSIPADFFSNERQHLSASSRPPCR